MRSRRFHRKTSAACANDDANAKTNANAELTRFVHLVFFFFSVFFMDSGPTRSRIRLNPPRMPSTTHPGLPQCHVSPADDHRPLGPGTAIRPRINTTHCTSKLPPATCTSLPRPVPRLHHRASNWPPCIRLGPHVASDSTTAHPTGPRVSNSPPHVASWPTTRRCLSPASTPLPTTCHRPRHTSTPTTAHPTWLRHLNTGPPHIATYPLPPHAATRAAPQLYHCPPNLAH